MFLLKFYKIIEFLMLFDKMKAEQKKEKTNDFKKLF